jgi:hypothetical protein
MRMPVEERFWSKVDFDGECWSWLRSSRTPEGYGLFYMSGRHFLAHRLAYQELVACIPSGLTLDHLCRNRGCVNPSHLEPVAMRENVLRGIGPTATNSQKVQCIRGHDLAGDNLDQRKLSEKGWRVCLECQRQHAREYGTKRSASRNRR